jgi:hypothetical protein
MARKSKKSTASSLDVRTPKEIPIFEKLLSKGPMAIVLVYADWCGHCTNFKEKVWNDSTLSKTKNMNTAAVHYDMLDQTSLKNTPVNGYPSMFLVGKDKQAKEVPTPQTSEELLNFDTTSSSALNNSSNSNTLNRVNNNTNLNNTNNTNNSVEIDTPEFLPSPNENSYTPRPPDALDDVVNSSEVNESPQTGGSLFDVLSQFTQKGGRSVRRKTSKRKNRRRATRRRQ